MRGLPIACAALLAAPVAGAAAQGAAELTLVDPDRDAPGAPAAERDWSLRISAGEPLGKRERRALVALARPCSNWVAPLRERDAAAGQRMFEQCMTRAMSDSFDEVAVLPGAVQSADAGGEEARVLEALMRIELDCVGRLVAGFGPLEQERYRSDYSSFHVAQYKVQFARRCLKERMAEAGLEGRATYHYRPSRAAPRNH